MVKYLYPLLFATRHTTPKFSILQFCRSAIWVGISWEVLLVLATAISCWVGWKLPLQSGLKWFISALEGLSTFSRLVHMVA